MLFIMPIFGRPRGASPSAINFYNIYCLAFLVELGITLGWVYLRLGNQWLLRDVIYGAAGAVVLYVLYQSLYKRELPLSLPAAWGNVDMTLRGWRALLVMPIYLVIAFAVPMIVSGLK